MGVEEGANRAPRLHVHVISKDTRGDNKDCVDGISYCYHCKFGARLLSKFGLCHLEQTDHNRFLFVVVFDSPTRLA